MRMWSVVSEERRFLAGIVEWWDGPDADGNSERAVQNVGPSYGGVFRHPDSWGPINGLPEIPLISLQYGTVGLKGGA